MNETNRRGRKRADGEGTIYHRKDGLWRGELMVGYKLDGKRDVRTVTAKTQAECRRRLDELKRRAHGGLLAEADKKQDTVAAYLARWLEAIKDGVRTSTWQRYDYSVRLHLIPGLGRHRLTALKPDDIRRFYRAKAEAGLSPSEVHHLHAALHKALNDAVVWEYIPLNPCTRVKAPNVLRREITPPTAEELGRLVDAAEAASDRLTALWTTAIYSGCRQGELLGLKWEDVDLTKGTISIRRTLLSAKHGAPQYGEPKTAKSRRKIRLSPDALQALSAHRDRQNWERQRLGEGWTDCGLVFVSMIGTPLDKRNVTRFFKSALKRVELSEAVRFHDLRHAAATLMLEAGVDTKTTSARLGHSTTAITQDLYQHWIQALDDQAAERLQQVLKRSDAR